MNIKAIYCVDDDDVINKVLLFQISKFIESEEIVVETCNHPKECIEMMKENQRLGIEPLICVVDFQMPEMRGDEFSRSVKSLFPKIKIIMLSGNSNALLVSELEEEGCLDFYLTKPWEKDDLKDKINLSLPLNLKFM